jgi:hypothetical protein
MGPVTSYTDDDILLGLSKAGISSITAGAALFCIRRSATTKGDKPQMRKLTDTDIVTVKELREAEQRMRPLGFPSQVFPVQAILDDVMEHREPEYPAGTVWQDANGIPWQRLPDGMWLKMGSDGKYSYSAPRRPLERMDVI